MALSLPGGNPIAGVGAMLLGTVRYVASSGLVFARDDSGAHRCARMLDWNRFSITGGTKQPDSDLQLQAANRWRRRTGADRTATCGEFQ
jgi:hypothetical protein